MLSPEAREQLGGVFRLLFKAQDPTIPPATPTKPWPAASYRDFGTVLLLLDGWGSIGHDKRHLVTVHRSELRKIDERWNPVMRAFSYAEQDEPGQSYDQYHTTQIPLGDHVEALMAVISGSPNCEWLICGYSLGSIVATIALGRLSKEKHPIRPSVPLLILVAPALHGAPDFLEFLESGEVQFHEFPLVAIDIGREDGRYPREARSAISELLDAGIAVTIIHSQHDQFAPHHPLDDPRIFYFEPSGDLLSKSQAINPYMTHVRMRTLEDNHRLVYYVTKPLVSLEEPQG